MSDSQAVIIRPTDSELLMQFVKSRNDEAFRFLVERHSRLVQNVCRRVLPNEQDVEDAFQATFLVLARSAESIRCRDSLVGWLFKVAHRTAKRAALDGRRRKQVHFELEIPCGPLLELEQRETFEILVTELNLLPERFRAPLILHYLEGKSRRIAAAELDCSDAALKSRLARGRRLLRHRLTRRGIAMSVAMTASAATAKAAVAPAMIQRTASAAIKFSTTGKAGSACSLRSVSLAEGIKPMTSLTLTKSLTILGVIVSAGLVVGGIGSHHLAALSDENSTRDNRNNDTHLADELSTVLAAEQPKPAADSNATVAFSGKPPNDKPNKRTASNGPGALRRRSSVERKIEATLNEHTSLEFIDTPLSDAVSFIADRHWITILIDKQALDEAGASTDTPINLTLSGITLHSALNNMLKPLDLTYVIEDDVMKITSQHAAQERKEIRVYPVQDLIAAGFEPAALKRIIEQGTKGNVEPLPGFLVIKGSQQMHRKTAELLKQLHQAARLSRLSR
jgi:RNA polymerase sigma factor (sigma-70 family)